MSKEKSGGNPTVEIGDLVVLISSKGGIPSNLLNTIFEVTALPQGNPPHVQALSKESGQLWTLYCKSDIYVKATREVQIENYKAKLVLLDAEAKKLVEKITFLETYASEEEFVAHKLEAILSAHSKGTSKKARIEQMTALLTELKQSDIL